MIYYLFILAIILLTISLYMLFNILYTIDYIYQLEKGCLI
jgi:hypothetical protein